MDTKQAGKKVLVIDVGGSNVKVLVTGAPKRKKIPSGSEMTAAEMVAQVQETVEEQGWEYDVVSLGLPCAIIDGQVMREPVNLGEGWVGFDFEDAFGCPVKVINDAALQAYGSYEGGRMLFLGLGTGLGTALVIDGMIIPLEAGHLPYDKTRKSMEDYVGKAGRKVLGEEKWQKHCARIIESLRYAFNTTDVVIGGGNAKELDPFPKGAREVDNAAAFVGGFRLWETEH